MDDPFSQNRMKTLFFLWELSEI